MIIEQLKELFPEAVVNDATRMGEKYFSIPVENKWIHFPPESITEREKQLVLQIATPDGVMIQKRKNRWATFLLENPKKIPPGFNQVQLLQIMIKNTNKENFDYTLWLDAFKHTFSFIEDGFFISDHYGIIVIHNPTYIELTEEIDGILNVLDDDFTIQTSVYLGQNWPVNEHLPSLFAEEQQIFLDTRSSSKRNKITTLSEIALPHFSYEATAKSVLLRQLKTEIRELEGGADLVDAMWHNLGNVSKAAGDLYVHRNTLQYRLDRFFQATGLNLKTMDDLLLSYLAVMSRFEDL
ncbi:helix-turn-helix domain-containing protein [Jeotgalibaca caeni]|uniref:helix-turn-helix domain-containing protein n=1 Tax=Jeotgalibaca caeni TaxID=3028623 RepID=UPI00237EBAAB|nr:helix-turn-helix domain-containing protein [Jeotgalibaca caeni]MDE1549937.1 helix-turn-helix domain-containing protein [Jeotgalibaca caeni]